MRLKRVIWMLVLPVVAGAVLVAAEDGWREVELPRAWEEGVAYGGGDSYSWYRCKVLVPADWEGRSLELFLEPVDDAKEVYWNGTRVARIGAMPPAYRSGLGGSERHPIPEGVTRAGETNVLAIRVYQNDSRKGFSVGAPVLFGGDEAIRLRGAWAFREGDDPAWARPVVGDRFTFVYDRVEERGRAERRLKLFEDGAGPLSPEASYARLKAGEELQVDLVLSEPAIGQPLSMKFDARGRLWVVQYLQYPDPAGLTMVSRDMHLRAVYDRVPLPPPRHFPGRDKVTIHEDTDGDGWFDRHKTFLEGLSLVTSVALGRGGVFALNPPYLLFYADRDGDDVPDGDPEVLLEGFGLEDSHSVANSLRWGPDGWLYGAQGSTVSGNIRRPGEIGEPVRTLGQLIWRYHPETHRYEVFAEGGGNTFGVEFDSKGRLFSGHNGGNTRGFHYVQGGYYQKGFGKHGELSNPHAYGYFQAMAHHDVPRFSHTFVVYDDPVLPERYRGKLFAVEPLQGRVVCSEIARDGSSFKTSDVGYALRSEDPWFRPVDIQVGPDGAVYVADFYEQRIDHASHYQGRIHRESGRIYRLRGKGRVASRVDRVVDLAGAGSVHLLGGALASELGWRRRTALRVIADRQTSALADAGLSELEKGLRPARAGTPSAGGRDLEWVWVLSACGRLDEETAVRFLGHPDPDVRAWLVRLICDDGKIGEAAAGRLEELARYEADTAVRSQLASSMRRLNLDRGWPVIEGLLLRDEDREDVHIPLLLWWAIEAKAGEEREALLKRVAGAGLGRSRLYREQIASRLMRRLASGGGYQELMDCVGLLRAAEGEERTRYLEGLEQAFVGRSLAGLPPDLSAALVEAGGKSVMLRARQGEKEALATVLQRVGAESTESFERLQYIALLGELKVPSAIPVLLDVVKRSRDDGARRAALVALGGFPDERIGRTVISVHKELPAEVRSAAQVLLSSRPGWTLEFLEAVESGRVDPALVTPAVARKFLLHNAPRIRERVQRHWSVNDAVPDEAALASVKRIKRVLAEGSGNPYKGRDRWSQLCAGCHVLFGKGGLIGPDLTAYERTDLDRLLMNVISPGTEIREGFENYVVSTKDGRTLNGFLVEQERGRVVLRGLDGNNVAVNREEVDGMTASSISLMPAGLLEALPDQEIRDLLAYLRSSQPLP